MENGTERLLMWLGCPEAFFLLALIIPPARRYILKLVEDSDGDPHHTDGFFVAVIWAGTLCIRTAVFIAYYMVVNNVGHIDLVITFLIAAGGCLGVRMYHSKISLENLIQKNKENEKQHES